MVVASGVNRVDERKLAKLAGGKVKRADADLVRKVTGYAIGGVPPFAHEQEIPVWAEGTLLPIRSTKPRPGVPNGVFRLPPADRGRPPGARSVEGTDSKA